jgi:hypothetical protein
MVTDGPDCKIEMKSFYCEILNDHEVLKREQDCYKDIEVILSWRMVWRTMAPFAVSRTTIYPHFCNYMVNGQVLCSKLMS